MIIVSCGGDGAEGKKTFSYKKKNRRKKKTIYNVGQKKGKVIMAKKTNLKNVGRLKVSEIKGDAKQNFLRENIGKTLKGDDLLRGLRASKLIDGKAGLCIKMYGALTKQIKVSTLPTSAKVEWEGMQNNPSRSKANLVMGLTPKVIAELKEHKASSIKG